MKAIEFNEKYLDAVDEKKAKATGKLWLTRRLESMIAAHSTWA